MDKRITLYIKITKATIIKIKIITKRMINLIIKEDMMQQHRIINLITQLRFKKIINHTKPIL